MFPSTILEYRIKKKTFYPVRKNANLTDHRTDLVVILKSFVKMEAVKCFDTILGAGSLYTSYYTICTFINES